MKRCLIVIAVAVVLTACVGPELQLATDLGPGGGGSSKCGNTPCPGLVRVAVANRASAARSFYLTYKTNDASQREDTLLAGAVLDAGAALLPVDVGGTLGKTVHFEVDVWDPTNPSARSRHSFDMPALSRVMTCTIIYDENSAPTVMHSCVQ
jgi:hypothetical protein